MLLDITPVHTTTHLLIHPIQHLIDPMNHDSIITRFIKTGSRKKKRLTLILYSSEKYTNSNSK